MATHLLPVASEIVTQPEQEALTTRALRTDSVEQCQLTDNVATALSGAGARPPRLHRPHDRTARRSSGQNHGAMGSRCRRARLGAGEMRVTNAARPCILQRTGE